MWLEPKLLYGDEMSEIKCAYELLTTFLNSCMSIVFYRFSRSGMRRVLGPKSIVKELEILKQASDDARQHNIEKKTLFNFRNNFNLYPTYIFLLCFIWELEKVASNGNRDRQVDVSLAWYVYAIHAALLINVLRNTKIVWSLKQKL